MKTRVFVWQSNKLIETECNILKNMQMFALEILSPFLQSDSGTKDSKGHQKWV